MGAANELYRFRAEVTVEKKPQRQGSCCDDPESAKVVLDEYMSGHDSGSS